MKPDACLSALRRLKTSSRSTALSLAASATNASRLSGGWASAWSSNASTFFQSSGCMDLTTGKLAIEPGLCLVPFANDGDRRKFQNFGSLINTQTSKEAQLNNPALAFVDLCQTLQSLIKRQQICILFGGDSHCFVE